MNNRKNIIIKLFIILFSISVSITVIPCGLINTYGLFGEIKSTTVTSDEHSGKEELSVISEHSHSTKKGENIYNIWLEIAITITYMIFTLYIFRLPRGDTIVTLKVRMDN